MRTLKLLLLLFLVLVAFSYNAQATVITVEAASIQGWQNSNTAPRLRIYCSKVVVTSDGTQIQFGNVSGQGVFYKSITCSVVGGVLQIPQLQIDSLTDALTGSDAKYAAYFYTSSGSQIAAYSGFTSFSVPGCPTCATTTTWAELLTFNSTFIPYVDNLTYNRTQIDAKIANVEAGGELSTVPFITASPSSLLTNEQAISLLATGLLKHMGGGILAVASGSDFQSPIGVTSPLTFVANVVGIPAASGSVNGYLSSTDWTTFNGKQAALGFTPINLATKDQANGVAGLTASTKLNLAQGQEVWSVNDLTEYSSASGSGATAIRSTISSPLSGQALTWNGTNWVNSNVATVTSVAASTDASFLTVGGSPITTSGTITVNLTTGLTQNLVVATPAGSSGTVSPRALVNGDLPVVDFSHGGTGLSVLGSAYTLVGVNSGATAYTPITLSAGANISITPSGTSLIIAAAAAGTHSLLSATHPDTTPASVTRGGTIVGIGSGTPSWQLKTAGAANTVFVSDGTDVGWGQVNLASSSAVTGIAQTVNGGLGLDASATNNGAIPIKNGSGFTIAQVIAGSNITITPGAGTLQIDASGTLGAAWSDLTSPAANLSLSMSTRTTTFTWGAATGAGVDMFTLKDGPSNTGSGHVAVIQTQASSAAKPILIAAGGTSNGVEMNTSGVLAPIGTGGITANALFGVAANGIQVRTSAGNFTARSVAAGAGIGVTNGDGVAGNPTIATDLSTLVASQTIFDGANASRTITFNLSGTDPVLTLGSGVFNVSTGTIQQAGVNVVLASFTLTGGTGINAIGDFTVNRTVSVDQSFSPTWTGTHTFTPTARNGTAASYFTINEPADTNIPASTESIGWKTVTATRTWATGLLNIQREFLFHAPTYNFNATSTLNFAATVDITGPPVAGANANMINRYALWIESGNFELDAGRITIQQSGPVFDLASSGLGTSLIISNSADISVASGKVYNNIHLSQITGANSVWDIAGTGRGAGLEYQLELKSTSSSSSALYGIIGQLTNKAPGSAKSGYFRTTMQTTSASAVGVAGVFAITATSGNPTNWILQLSGDDNTDQAIHIHSDNLTSANFIDGIVFASDVRMESGGAFLKAFWTSGHTGDFLSFSNSSGGANIFKVTQAGNIVTTGTISSSTITSSGDISGAIGTFAQVLVTAANANVELISASAGGLTNGWIIQQVDLSGSTSRYRVLKNDVGDVLGISNAGVTNLWKGGNVASAGTIAATGNVFHVTGTTNITSVSGTSIVAGTTITIIFDGILTFTDGSNLKLAGNFVTTADDTITLTYDGTNWYEVARAVN